MLTTVLLWMLIGSFAFGIGSFVAMYVIIKNTNALAIAYNEKLDNSATVSDTEQTEE